MFSVGRRCWFFAVISLPAYLSDSSILRKKARSQLRMKMFTGESAKACSCKVLCWESALYHGVTACPHRRSALLGRTASCTVHIRAHQAHWLGCRESKAFLKASSRSYDCVSSGSTGLYESWSDVKYSITDSTPDDGTSSRISPSHIRALVHCE